MEPGEVHQVGASVAPGERVAAYRCFVCHKSTREGKPYCPEHVMALGYPKKISDRWDLILAEKVRLMPEDDDVEPEVPTAGWLLTEELLLIVAAVELVCCRSKICRELGLDPGSTMALATAVGLKGYHVDRSVVYKPQDALAILTRRRAARKLLRRRAGLS